MPSFFIDFNTTDNKITIENEEFHHITNVFRHKTGDIITLINGKGLIAKAEIISINKKTVSINLLQKEHKTKKKKSISCAFSLLKNKNDFLLVEKLTELVIDELYPLITKNSVRMIKENSKEKFIKTAISACKQCDNAWLPIIHETQTLESFLQIKDKKLILCSERISQNHISNYINEKNICFIIGPEGGFDPVEYEMIERLNITQVYLTDNILRAETAAIYATSILI
jgi:16S rRNA (uracil1498-N3)-methyltransferase